MAQIVAGFGVPHTPIFPHFVKRDGPDCEIAKLFGAQKVQLAATRPDLIVMFDTDHLNTFFLDNLPIFAVGIDKSFKAPNDEPRDVPNYIVPSIPDVAAHVRAAVVAAGFDVGMTQSYSVDHSVIVPLHFLTPDMKVPVIPFFINGHVPPLPTAQRCHTLGRAVGRAIESWPASLRVVIMGSGSFSLEVGGPRMAPGRSDGVPDPDWAMRVINYLDEQKIEQLIAESRSIVKSRQRRRRTPELDRYAGCYWQSQAKLCRASDSKWACLRGLAMELNLARLANPCDHQ